MNWNFDQLERAQRYKLLVGLVVPRPIALVTSQSDTGVVNATPFSFFNVLADEPPEVSEIEIAGFTTAPSIGVKPPRITEAPAGFDR